MSDSEKNYGWVPDHRNIREWEWYRDVNTSHLYRHIKLSANWKTTQWRGITINRGQYKSSVRELAHETGLSKSKVETALKNLSEKTSYIKISPSGENNSLFTIINYEKEVHIPKKQLLDDIGHQESQNNEENTDTYGTDNDEHRTPNETLNETLNETPDETVIGQSSDTIYNNIYKTKKVRESSSPSDLENLDLKKERPNWYEYIVLKKPGITDEQINISYGIFLAMTPRSLWVLPAWKRWADKEIINKKQEVSKEVQEIDESQEALLDKIFRRVRRKLRMIHGDAIFSNWLVELKLIRRQDGVCHLEAPTKFIKEWVNNNYLEAMEREWKAIEPSIKRIEILTREKIHAT